MPDSDPTYDYLNLADSLFEGSATEADVAQAAVLLPVLDEPLLNRLAERAEALALTQPRRGWAVTQVADAAASAQQADLFLRSLAAWYLTRTLNHWTQPRRISEAVARARAGFEKLGQPGWMAACDWQLNAMPWTRPVFTEAARALARALEELQRAGLREYVPHCQLSLAYAQILTQQYDQAQQYIAESKAVFAAQDDDLNLARCWLHEASLLRRQDGFEQALVRLEQAGRVFEALRSIPDQAKAHYQTGLCHLMRTENLPEAATQLQVAIRLFSACDLDLWQAMATTNLGSFHLFAGDLALAEQCYQEASQVFAVHEIPGLLADSLSEFGEVNILRGRTDLGVERFKRALDLNETLGAALSAAVAMTSLGRAFAQAGRYQDALSCLERAEEHLQRLESPMRLGTCEKYLALVWLHLGQPMRAHEYLDRVTSNYERAGQTAMSSEAHSYRARAYLQQGRQAEAIESLERSLAVAVKYGVRPQAGLALRWLGEALVANAQYDEALDHLKRAEAESAAIDMQIDQAACLVAIGLCYVQLSRPDLARDAFGRALHLAGGASPEVEWRAHIGLGELAAGSDRLAALQAYRRGAETLASIRQNFWQPVLAGSYLQEPRRVLDRVVGFAADCGSVHDVLFLVEQAKASTLVRHLSSNPRVGWNARLQELADLQAEIRLLQDQLRTMADQPLAARATPGYQLIRAKLAQKAHEYGSLTARLERRESAGHPAEQALPGQFDLRVFREMANEANPGKWVALDYYFLEDRLVTIILTSQHEEFICLPVPPRFEMALRACETAQRNASPPLWSDLEALGQLLLPERLSPHLSPDTCLLIAPHRRLHHVPWAALCTGPARLTLADRCIPVILPSLEAMALLWRRSASQRPSRPSSGLLVGISEFVGRHRELPQVKAEIRALQAKLQGKGRSLVDGKATRTNLLRLSQAKRQRGLSRFEWLHLSSHFFSDTLTGRLSGLALQDVDVWLDQLRDLTPLPRLVTVSACNSSSAFVFEGDEHVDLPTTCLIAGAERVIGSLWPIPDRSATEFMPAFYDHYLAGSHPARALAEAQRQFNERGGKLEDWASFICIGLP